MHPVIIQKGEVEKHQTIKWINKLWIRNPSYRSLKQLDNKKIDNINHQHDPVQKDDSAFFA